MQIESSGLLPMARLVEKNEHHSTCFAYDRALVTGLIDRWRPKTHSFHLLVGEMTVSLQDVSLFGLPIDGDLVWAKKTPSTWRSDLFNRIRNVIHNDGQQFFEFGKNSGGSP
jgi:hypothetical protein